ncbi:MAG: FAD-dependent oxidoreductase [SAR324 cluster bacterium]|uniref:FAD-dependent oxidoreductase n=1 Tax=SAR324 cluster bacterium TaxID=2024889 RepID=A0A2A4SSN4_9DELT|nr:MAG: FAD-dependent oxidoreductase [SAR324 cluster bacterium]
MAPVDNADVLIIGGGLWGCAIAWYLSKSFPGRILILERNSVGFGASSRAAGLLTLARNQKYYLDLVRETHHAIMDLEAQLEEDLGAHQTGSFYLASSAQSKQSLQELVSFVTKHGVDVDWISQQEAQERVPLLQLEATEDLLIASMPEDKIIDPYILTGAYAKGAKLQGVKIRRAVAVERILTENNRVVGVATNQGKFSAPIVVNAGGVWSGKLMMELGIGLPMAPVRSQYWITEPSTKVLANQPFLIMPDAKAYARPEVGGLLFGLRESESIVVDPRILPENTDDLGIKADPEGWDTLLTEFDALGHLMPGLETMGIAHYIRGFCGYTLDGKPILGEVSGIDGLILATGCSGGGLGSSGGIGRVISDVILKNPNAWDLSPYRYDRLGKVDHYSPELQQRCGKARSGKTSG